MAFVRFMAAEDSRIPGHFEQAPLFDVEALELFYIEDSLACAQRLLSEWEIKANPNVSDFWGPINSCLSSACSLGLTK